MPTRDCDPTEANGARALQYLQRRGARTLNPEKELVLPRDLAHIPLACSADLDCRAPQGTSTVCPCPLWGCHSHQRDFHCPWRAGSQQGVWGAPEQPGPPCRRLASRGTRPGRVSGQAGAERWHSSSISQDDPSHRLAAGTEKMASGEQDSACQHPTTGPGDRAGPPATSHHLHTSTRWGRGAPWSLPWCTAETFLPWGSGKDAPGAGVAPCPAQCPQACMAPEASLPQGWLFWWLFA